MHVAQQVIGIILTPWQTERILEAVDDADGKIRKKCTPCQACTNIGAVTECG